MKNKKNLDLNKLEPKLDESLNKSLTAREHNTPLIEQLLNETTPQEMTEIDKQMSEKTAVDWFVEQLKTNCGISIKNTSIGLDLISKANEMFKEQMIQFAWEWSSKEVSKSDLELDFKQKYGGNK